MSLTKVGCTLVTDAAAIDAHPVNALNQQPLQAIFFQRCTAEFEALQRFLLADKLGHGLFL
jgi:hypothetical protein